MYRVRLKSTRNVAIFEKREIQLIQTVGQVRPRAFMGIIWRTVYGVMWLQNETDKPVNMASLSYKSSAESSSWRVTPSIRTYRSRSITQDPHQHAFHCPCCHCLCRPRCGHSSALTDRSGMTMLTIMTSSSAVKLFLLFLIVLPTLSVLLLDALSPLQSVRLSLAASLRIVLTTFGFLPLGFLSLLIFWLSPVSKWVACRSQLSVPHPLRSVMRASCYITFSRSTH